MSAETGPSIYDQVGGQHTIDHAMNILFDEIVPRHPELVAVFGDRSTDPEKRDRHAKAVGWAVGALLGGPGNETVTVGWIIERHPNSTPKPLFDGTINGIVEAFNRTGEELEQPTHKVIATLVPLVPEFEAGMVRTDK